jgi:putative ABC transport system permease protein
MHALRAGTLLVADDQAAQNRLTVGQKLRVLLPRGTRDVTVVGIYRANPLAGPYLLDESAAAAFETRLNTALLITAGPGVDAIALRTAVDRATASQPNVDVFDQRQLTSNASSQIDTVMALLNVLLLLSVGIALLGIVNTLALSVIDRTRELGLLRAVGLSRPQTRRMIDVEAVIVAVFGALLGISVGTAFGVALQSALHGQGVTVLAIPYPRLALFVLAAAGAGIVAAVLPARRAAHLNVLNAISTT